MLNSVWNFSFYLSLPSSVAEPPLFWAAPSPAPEVQGPGADSGSDQIGSAPGKKGGSGSIH